MFVLNEVFKSPQHSLGRRPPAQPAEILPYLEIKLWDRPLTVTDLMDLSVILRAISSALMVAKTARLFQSAYKSSLSNVFLLFLLCSSLSFSCFLSATLLHSPIQCTPSVGALKMSLIIGSNPLRAPSYLNTFTICSPSVAESLA